MAETTPIYEATREHFLSVFDFDDLEFDVEKSLRYVPPSTRKMIDAVELRLLGSEKPKKKTAVPVKRKRRMD